MLKLNFVMCMHNILQKNSNTTIVKVKFTSKFLFPSTISYSNTTIVKVKFPYGSAFTRNHRNSNTTIVKVKFLKMKKPF